MVPYGANYRRANEIIGREERERELQYGTLTVSTSTRPTLDD